MGGSWLMLVATLVLSVTYQAAINPPGGVWQDDLINYPNGRSNHTAGVPIRQDKNPQVFRVFKMSNTTALAQSIVIIIILLKRTVFQYSHLYVHALRVLVITTLLALGTAYSTLMIGPNFLPFRTFDYILVNVVFTMILLVVIQRLHTVAWDDDKKGTVKLWVALVCWLLCSLLLFCLELVVLVHRNIAKKPWFHILFSACLTVISIIYVYWQPILSHKSLFLAYFGGSSKEKTRS